MQNSVRILVFTCLTFSACASPGSDLHLAPLISRHTAPDFQHVEALGGILKFQEKGETSTWALQPAFYKRNDESGIVEAAFLGGLGYYQYQPKTENTYSHFVPLYTYHSEIRSDGVRDTDWSSLLWLIGGGSSSDELENYFWVFPFYGTGKNVLTFDEFKFILFPLYLENKKQEQKSYHYMWPFFGYSEGPRNSFHFWPFYGQERAEGKYFSEYYMWPLLHRSEDDLDKKFPRKAWLFFPFLGYGYQDDYEAFTLIPPIFGYAHRPSTGYLSWQVWPLFKHESSKEAESKKVTRILPFWMHFKNDQTEYSVYLWPFFWDRKDDYGNTTRESKQLVPLFLWAKTKHEDGTTTKDLRIWPFVGYTKRGDLEHKIRTLDLGMPGLFNSETVARAFSSFYQFWLNQKTIIKEKTITEKRAFLNLYHSIESDGHFRWSIPFLGGQWTEPNGVTHSSWLLGLIRWKSGHNGGWESPAFPGPGWPDLKQ